MFHDPNLSNNSGHSEKAHSEGKHESDDKGNDTNNTRGNRRRFHGGKQGALIS